MERKSQTLKVRMIGNKTKDVNMDESRARA